MVPVAELSGPADAVLMSERALVQLATRQHGLVTTQQAGQLGFDRGAVTSAVAKGRWRRAGIGVLALGATPATLHQRTLAAVLSIGEAWASHSTAARVWGWEVRHARVEVIVPGGRKVERRNVRVHRSTRLDPEDVAIVGGIPVTSPARTLIDLSGRITVDELATCLDTALRRRQATIDAVDAMVIATQATYGRRPRVLSDLVELRRCAGPAESPLEARVLRVLTQAGVPLPTCQHRITVGVKEYRLDMAWVDAQVFSEADGFEHHESRKAFDADRHRTNHLAAAGWTGVHLTSAFSDDEIVEAVRNVLALAKRPDRRQ